MLYTAAKVLQLGLFPQGQPERYGRVKRMVDQMDKEGFGTCRNYAECEAQCRKETGIKFIAQMNRDSLQATLRQLLDRSSKMSAQ